MSPEALLDKIESTGKVEAKIIGKLRRQVENPEKEVSIKKILSFLVKNEYLTKDEAVDIRKELKFETKVKLSGGKQTDELVAGVMDPSGQYEEAEVAEVDEADSDPDDIADAPTEFGGGVDYGNDYMDDKTLVLDPKLDDLQADYDAMADPLGSSWDESLPESAGVQRPKIGFDGKLDSSDQWSTKWIFIGFGVLGFLLFAGTLLTFVLSLITAEDRFESAMQSFEANTYGDAIKKLDEFLEKHSRHEKVPIAKVTRVQALLRDTFRQKNWDETVVRAETYLPPIVEDEEIDLEKVRQDLADILPKTALAMAKRATKQEKKSELVKELDKAKNAKKLVDNSIYIPNSRRKQANVADLLEKLEEEIAKGNILIRRQDDFEKAMTDIRSFRDQGQTDKAFEVYNNLVRNYGDLRSRQELVEEMRMVSQQEAQLVKPIPSNISTVAQSRPSPIESSIVLAAKSGEPISSLRGETLAVLADGSVYSIDAGDGSVQWRRYVGYQTDIQPINLESGSVLISDQLNNDLILTSAKDGQVIWRSEIGEPFMTPQVDEEMIFLTTQSGNLSRISLKDGSVMASSKIPQRASVPMVRFARRKLALQAGYYSNLYLLNEEDLSCQDVIYLGHKPGAIYAEPVAWKSFVLICVNLSGVCDLYVLGPNPETKKLELIQRIRPITRGQVTNAPTRFGRFMLVNSEEGDLKILELDSANETTPVRVLDSEKFENQDGARTYLATAGSQLWVASKGIMRYKVSRSLGTFDRQVIANPDDSFLGPLYKIGDSIIHIRKRFESELTSVSAVDGSSLKQIWRTDLGGPLAGSPIVSGNSVTAISSQGDLFTFENDRGQNQVASDGIKSSNISQNLLFDQTFDLGDSTGICVGPPSRADLLYFDSRNQSSKLVRLPPPADKSACRPIQIGKDLIFATRQGQVVRVNPETGKIVGTPFLPPTNPGTDVKWMRPALVNGDRFVIGHNNSLYLIDASDESVLKNVAQLDLKEVILSPLVAIGDKVFGVFESNKNQMIHSIDVGADNLTASGSLNFEAGSRVLVPLPADENPDPWNVGIWSNGDRVLVQMENDNVVSFDSGLNQQWSVIIPQMDLAADPIIDGNLIRLVFSNGKILNLKAESGAIESEFELGQPIVHPPVLGSGKALIAGSDGTIHNIKTLQ